MHACTVEHNIVRVLRAQALAAFSTAAAQYGATARRAHARAESVGARASDSAWLVCSFHEIFLLYWVKRGAKSARTA